MAIADFFKDKNIFMTGASGFLGKLLIEKILRSCPDVGNIYVLLRPRKNRSVEERLEAMKAVALFDLLRKKQPDVFKKLIPIKGDVSEVNLGISDSDRQILTDNVNIIYHTAASVRFDEHLKDTVFLNVRGTREVAQLALDLKHVSLFVHVSTTYCNSDKLYVEEKLYPPHADWRDAIKLAEEYDEQILDTMSMKYIHPLPNTYTFAKSLAEHVVDDMCRGTIPCVIVRPSVVVNTHVDPIVGWNDNFNGPMGLGTACLKGLIRVTLGKSDSQTDYIPADFVIKGMIQITELIGRKPNFDETEVFNVSENAITAVTQGEMLDFGKQVCKKFPFSIMMWYPRFSMTSCWYNYYIQVLLFHMLPAAFFDMLLRLIGKKAMFFKLQRKIYIANYVLVPFMSNTFSFINDKLWSLQKELKEEDSDFAFHYTRFNAKDKFEFFKNCQIGMALYIFKEKFDFTGKESMKLLTKFWYADIALKTIFFGFVFWILFIHNDILGFMLNGLQSYINNLN